VPPLSGRDRSEFFDGGSSFPSGHSIEAWSLAAVIANDTTIIVGCKWALTNCHCRKSLEFTAANTISDVLVGSARYGIGRYVYRAHHRANDSAMRKESRSRSKTISLDRPRVQPARARYGVALAWSFEFGGNRYLGSLHLSQALNELLATESRRAGLRQPVQFWRFFIDFFEVKARLPCMRSSIPATWLFSRSGLA